MAPDLLAVIQGLYEGELGWPLYLFGQTGTGKTAASLAVLDHVEHGNFWVAHDYHRERIDAQFGRLPWHDRENGRSGTWIFDRWRIRMLREPELIVLDDLGSKASVSQAGYEYVLDLLMVRENSPLIVTSNLTLEAIEEVYDGRVASRLAAGTVFELKGADRRTL